VVGRWTREPDSSRLVTNENDLRLRTTGCSPTDLLISQLRTLAQRH